MNQRIEQLKTQIQGIQSQLTQLKQEQQELQQSLPAPAGNEPSEVAAVAKAAAIAFAQRLPQLQGIEDAIALLEQRLPPLQAELALQQKEQDKDVFRAKVDELEPELLEVCGRINRLSGELETACEEYRHLALEYNRVRSELGGQQAFPVVMHLTGLPWVVSQIGRGFSLKLAMKKIGEQVAFEQQPKPYVPASTYVTPIETRIDLLKSSLTGLKNYRRTIDDWDLARIALTEGQIRETERQLRELEQQEEASKV